MRAVSVSCQVAIGLRAVPKDRSTRPHLAGLRDDRAINLGAIIAEITPKTSTRISLERR